MTDTGSGWTPPDPASTPWAPPSQAAAPTAATSASVSTAYAGGSPLGGTQPLPVQSVEPSQRRELVLTTVLLVSAVVAGAASLMSWRDDGFVVGPAVNESGWVLPDGSLGRGWVAVLLGVVLAVAGVLVASGRLRSGRAMAMIGGVGLIVFSILEWGLGAGRARTGPGTGIWVLLVVGVVVVIAVGILGSPPGEPARD